MPALRERSESTARMLAGVLLRPQMVMPAAQRLHVASRQYLRSKNNTEGDTVHFGATQKQHRVVNVIASLFFLAGATFWGIAEHNQGHEVASAEMMAPVMTGAGSLLSLANAGTG